MDFVTRQFIVLVKKLRKDFRKALVSAGMDLHDIKNSIQSIDENSRAYQQKEQPKPELFAVLHEPESSQAERHTANRGTKRRDRVRLLVEWLTFFAVLFYGYMAVRQWKEMIAARHQVGQSIDVANRSATAAENTLRRRPYEFRVEERAYVTNEFTLATKNGADVIHAVFHNSGKTPAINLYLDATVSSATVGNVPLAINTQGVSSSVLAPNGDQPFDLPYGLNEPFKTAFSHDLIPITLKGTVRYNDIFGSPHWTKYCIRYMFSWKEFRWCTNDVGINAIDMERFDEAPRPTGKQ